MNEFEVCSTGNSRVGISGDSRDPGLCKILCIISLVCNNVRKSHNLFFSRAISFDFPYLILNFESFTTFFLVVG